MFQIPNEAEKDIASIFPRKQQFLKNLKRLALPWNYYIP